MSELLDDVVDLQTKVLFQEDVIQKLDEVIIQQSEKLERLERRIQQLEDKYERLDFDRDAQQTITDEKPPHY